MCALLHDNALTQYISEELKKDSVIDLKKDLSEEKTNLHCIYGEKNITKLPFKTDVSNVILYHHEHADGTGSFQKKWNEIPLFARIIHLADIIDIIRNSIDSDDNSWDLWGTVTIGSKGQIVIPKAAREAFEHEKQKQEDLGLHCEVTIDGYTDFIFINRFVRHSTKPHSTKQSEELSVIAMMSSFCTVMNLMCYFLILAATRLDIHLQQECVKLE